MFYKLPLLSALVFSGLFCVPVHGQSADAAFAVWKRLYESTGDDTFEQAADFILTHEDWPEADKLALYAESKITQGSRFDKMAKFFDKYPPQSFKGVMAYLAAMRGKAGYEARLRDTAAGFWIRSDFTKDQLREFLTKYGTSLSKETFSARFERLIMQDCADQLQMLLSLECELPKYLDSNLGFTIRGLLAGYRRTHMMMTQGCPGDFDKLPDDPAVFYVMLKKYRAAKEDGRAIRLLQAAAALTGGIQADPRRKLQAAAYIALESKYPDRFWNERNILARRMIEKKRYRDAHMAIAGHRLTTGEDYAHAQWQLSWLETDYLKNHKAAFHRMAHVYDKVGSPFSKSRMAFWAGRSAEKFSPAQSKEWYRKAAHFQGAFYGMAACGVLGTPLNIRVQEPQVSEKDRVAFNNKPMVQLIRTSLQKETAPMRMLFLTALCKEVKTPVQQTLLMKLASQTCGVFPAVFVAKKTSVAGVALNSHGFPLLPEKVCAPAVKVHKPASPDRLTALAHAVIRQETNFQPDALSNKKAMGLMQVIESTAKEELCHLKKLGVCNLSMKNLYEPFTNVHLGVSHLNRVLQEWQGSLILALAAYNAGPVAVKEWISLYGDPRKMGTDLIRWIELISYEETRTYIHRVLESFVVFSHMIGAGKKAALTKVTFQY